MSPAKATLQACGGIYSQLEDRFIMLIFQPQHILKRMLLNSFSTLLNPAMLYSCLLLDLCSETWRGNAVWSPSNTKHIFYHNKCSCIIKTNVALVKVFELLLKGGGDWGGVVVCHISVPAWWADRTLNRPRFCRTVSVTPRCPAAPVQFYWATG